MSGGYSSPPAPPSEPISGQTQFVPTGAMLVPLVNTAGAQGSKNGQASLTAIIAAMVAPYYLANAAPGAAIVAEAPAASPYTFTATQAGALAVSGGTVSAIALMRGSTSVSLGAIAGFFAVRAEDQIIVTYTVAPTVNFVPA